MTTVITLPGAASGGNQATVQAAFGGPVSLLQQLGINDSSPNVVGVTYTDGDPFWGYMSGADQASKALHAAPANDEVVVVGHSYGAVSLVQLLRNPAQIPQDPSKIIFVLAANSVTPYTGLCAQWGEYGGAGPLNQNTYQVYNCVREFDKWADTPNDMWSSNFWDAYNNCQYGDMVTGSPGGVPNNIHNSYQAVDLTDPNAAVAQVGSVKFMLFETDPVPHPETNVSRRLLEKSYTRVMPNPSW